MIKLSELCVLLQNNNIKLKTSDILTIHKSLIEKNFCFFNPRTIRQHNYKKLYNNSWLFHQLTEVRHSIKKWTGHHKIKILTIDDVDYPASLLSLENAPASLYVMGSFKNLNGAIAIVGRREAKSYTLNWMEENLPKIFSSKVPTVVSGGARGVDTKAHQLALLNECPTVYVMPSGLLNLYPKHLNSSAAELIKSGATFISAYHPNSEMRKQNFSDRNWIIAALASKVIILEAEIRSGTYKTAMYALELDRNLGVVPSFPTDQSYSGSLQLIYDGANMLRGHEDLNCFIDEI